MSRSGTATTPNAARKRKMVMLTLSPEALAKLLALPAGTRSAWVAALILASPAPPSPRRSERRASQRAP
jgi:hypothetical protein